MKRPKFLKRVECSQSPDGEHLMFGKPFMNKKPLDDYPNIIIDFIDVDFSVLKCAHCGHTEAEKHG